MPSFAYIEKLASRLHGWIGRSSLRNEKLQAILEVMEIERLKVINIHHIRWLSRGQVMERLTRIMPTVLALFKGEEGDEELYHGFTNFSVLFFIYLLADVLKDLNILNQKFQEENLDLSKIGASMEITMRTLRRKFLVTNEFGVDEPFITIFLEISRGGTIEYQDATGYVHTHTLHYAQLPSSTFEGTIEGCKAMAREYVLKVLECLELQFSDMRLFNATKLFSLLSYSSDDLFYRNRDLWLKIFLEHFCVEGSTLMDIQGCQMELRSFMNTISIFMFGTKNA